ncbi:MAG: phosphate acyltransferase [Bacteroidales bacterium]
MKPIGSFAELSERLKGQTPKTIAVVLAEDPHTIGAVLKASREGFARFILTGHPDRIAHLLTQQGAKPSDFVIHPIHEEAEAVRWCVEQVNQGGADVLMKGLVNTDNFLRAVLNKETGLMIPGAVMSYVAALEIPSYHKLLFITDTAVIPFPDLNQKIAMLNYAVNMCHRFGIMEPKVALISATEKAGLQPPSVADYAIICKMAERGQIKGCVVDGPLDVFLATVPESLAIKKVNTPIQGDADVLLFPTLEACNAFYKGLVRFAGAELAGLIRGTRKPVIVMSRSESEQSKFNCIALACLMAES